MNYTVAYTTSEYWKDKMDFFKKHPLDKVHTSPMDEYGGYNKTYICEDGAQWFEDMGIVPVTERVVVRGVPVNVTVNLFRTEYWNTTEAGTKVTYEEA